VFRRWVVGDQNCNHHFHIRLHYSRLRKSNAVLLQGITSFLRLCFNRKETTSFLFLFFSWRVGFFLGSVPFWQSFVYRSAFEIKKLLKQTMRIKNESPEEFLCQFEASSTKYVKLISVLINILHSSVPTQYNSSLLCYMVGVPKFTFNTLAWY
jgi:hypothetical protein